MTACTRRKPPANERDRLYSTRRRARADLADEGMAVRVAALRGVGNREQKAFVAAREVLEVRNDRALAEAGAQLLQAFERLAR
jgi:hypothetical protein